MNDMSFPSWRARCRRSARFLTEDDGAVTVDWVVLTAAIVLLGLAAGFTVSSNVPVLADKIAETVESQPVNSY